MDGEDILVIGFFGGLSEDGDGVWEAKFPIFIRFKGEDIWDYVSTAESVKIAKEKISVYPNPGAENCALYQQKIRAK